MINRPQIFNHKQDLPVDVKVVEAYESALKEIFFVSNPHLKKVMPEAIEKLVEFLQNHSVPEIWIYYPDQNTAVHTVSEDWYFKLRTARNKNIITEQEQELFRNIKVGVAGLSVGSAIVSALAVSGGPKFLKIADFDEVEVSNLNRIRARLQDVGLNKADVSAREVWALDPFAEIEIWDKGVNKQTIEKFITDPQLDILVDEMDSIDVKILARLAAREKHIPVLMATDNGDSIILDVERFDLEPERQIFHGLIGDFSHEQAENLDYKQWLQLATKIVGPEFLTERMQDSLLVIGREVAGVPQLGTTASIAGSAISFAMRRIAAGLDMPSGRYQVGCEDKVVPGYNSPEQVQSREIKTQEFLNKFGKR
jgi:hypothetical protein